MTQLDSIGLDSTRLGSIVHSIRADVRSSQCVRRLDSYASILAWIWLDLAASSINQSNSSSKLEAFASHKLRANSCQLAESGPLRTRTADAPTSGESVQSSIRLRDDVKVPKPGERLDSKGFGVFGGFEGFEGFGGFDRRARQLRCGHSICMPLWRLAGQSSICNLQSSIFKRAALVELLGGRAVASLRRLVEWRASSGSTGLRPICGSIWRPIYS